MCFIAAIIREVGSNAFFTGAGKGTIKLVIWMRSSLTQSLYSSFLALPAMILKSAPGQITRRLT